MKCEPCDAARPRGSFGRGRALLRWLIARIDGALLLLERNRQRRLLHSFSNHMLKDIGLSRADVEGEFGKQPWQR